MFSSNIIERHHALSELLSFNFLDTYALAIVALAFICWRLKEWL